MAEAGRRLQAIWQSFATKLALLVLIFAAIPLALYTQFESADSDKNALLLRVTHEESRLIAETLRPLLGSFQAGAARRIADELERLGGKSILVRLLFRPKGTAGPDAFYLIATNPRVPAEYVEKERAELIRTGVLARLDDTCQTDVPQAIRYTNTFGTEEVLTAITPIHLQAGCWAVVTAHSQEMFVGSSVGQPYWRSPEIRVALAIYLLLAVIVLSLFLDVWRSLRRFEGLARDIRVRGPGSGSFQSMNEVPELDQVAREFDRLVTTLRDSANAIRQAAEENAHALKAPLAVMAQSVEPLRRATAPDDTRSRRAIELIERSIARMDDVVSATRRMEQVTAEMIDPPREPVDLSSVLAGMLDSYAETAETNGVRLVAAIARDVRVVGGEDLFETVIENLIENALGFAPRGTDIRVELETAGPWARLVVCDRGPGVMEKNLGRIFERNFSDRTNQVAHDDGTPGRQNFGIGLWIVKRNVEAIGGSVEAGNRPEGGFLVLLRLPLAS